MDNKYQSQQRNVLFRGVHLAHHLHYLTSDNSNICTVHAQLTSIPLPVPSSRVHPYAPESLFAVHMFPPRLKKQEGPIMQTTKTNCMTVIAICFMLTHARADKSTQYCGSLYHSLTFGDPLTFRT